MAFCILKPSIMKLLPIIFVLVSTLTLSAQSTFKKSFHPNGGCPDAIATIDGGYALLTTGGYPGMVKCDADGNTEWAVGLEFESTLFCQGITETMNGDYFLLMNGDVDDNRQMIVTKVTDQGQFSKSKRFFHSSTNEGRDLIADGEGGVLFTGGGCNGNNYVIRLDKDMNVIFEKGYDILNAASATRIIKSSNGNFILAGTALDEKGTRAAVLLEIDINGEIIWSGSYTGLPETIVYSVIQLQDGGYAFAGQAKYNPNGTADMIVCRLDADKEVIWIRILETGWESVKDLVQLPDGDLFFCGNMSATNNNDGLVGRMGLNGQLDYIKTMKGTTFDVSDVLNRMVPVCEDKFAVFGDTDGGSMFFIDDQGEGFCNNTTIPLSMVDVQDAVYQKLEEEVRPADLSFQSADMNFTTHSDFLEEEVLCDYVDPSDSSCGSVSNIDIALPTNIVISPNPASESVAVYNAEAPIIAVHIFDGSGRRVQSEYNDFGDINISNLSSGFYVLEVETKDGKTTRKLIKE